MNHALAFDESRGRIVLFGGWDHTNPVKLGDTWEWDGSTWEEMTPTVSPPARDAHSMAYDATRRRVVLFGGQPSFSGILADTWLWDGANCTEAVTDNGPAARRFHAMVYDAQGDRTVLFGGSNPNFVPTYLDDTWVWDGSRWTAVDPRLTPPRRSGHAMAYDAARQRVVLFSGEGTRIRSSTWIFGETEPASQVPYGAGCAGSHGTPHLEGYGQAQLGNDRFALDLSSVRPFAPVIVAVSAEPAQTAIGTCTLLVDTSTGAFAGASANATGFVSIPAPVPNDPAFLGMQFYVQAAALDPAGRYLSLSFTNGLRITVGG